MTLSKNDQFCQNISKKDIICCEIDRMIISGKTRYQAFEIFDSETLGRCVVIDGDLQSSEIDLASYHEALVHPAMLFHNNPQSVLVCGGGDSVTIREVLRYQCVKELTMVDIDKEFVEICKKHLEDWHYGAFDDIRLEIVYEDIFKFVSQKERKYDIIIGSLPDVLDEVSPGNSFYAENFYANLKELLNPDGIFVTQASGLALFNYTTHTIIKQNIEKVFNKTVSYRTAVDSFFIPWSFIISGIDKIPFETDLVNIFRNGFEAHHLLLEHFDPSSLAACFTLNKKIRAILTNGCQL